MKRTTGTTLAALVWITGLGGIALDTSCAALDCGYGGPGCGAAELEGACGGALPLGAARDVRIVFADDTGRHEASVRAIDADAAVDVTRLSMGRFRLVGLAAGSTSLVCQVDGWSGAQTFDLVVSAIDGGVADASAADAGGSCARVSAR